MRRGVGVTEMLVAVSVVLVVLTTGYMLVRAARVSTEASLGPSMGLQLNSRKALVEMVRELQESIEIVRPSAGGSLSYLLARDKLNRILTLYIVKNERDSTRAGRPLHDLYLYRFDHGERAPAMNQRLVLSGVERAAFTALSSGLVQVHLDLHEQGKSFPFLTGVRCRNISTEGEL